MSKILSEINKAADAALFNFTQDDTKIVRFKFSSTYDAHDTKANEVEQAIYCIQTAKQYGILLEQWLLIAGF